MQYSVGAAPASMSLASTLAAVFTTVWNADITRLSDTFDRFEATHPGWVSWLVTGEPAARNRRSSSRPHSITASLDRP